MINISVKTEKPLSVLSSFKLNFYCSSKSFCCYPKYKTQKWCAFAVIAILHSVQLAIGLDMNINSTRMNLVYPLTSDHYANLLRENLENRAAHEDRRLAIHQLLPQLSSWV